MFSSERKTSPALRLSGLIGLHRLENKTEVRGDWQPYCSTRPSGRLYTRLRSPWKRGSVHRDGHLCGNGECMGLRMAALDHHRSQSEGL